MKYEGYEIRRYLSAEGKDIFGGWLSQLNDMKARARISARILRLAGGNFGDCKLLRSGVYELRIDYGPGYRVYYAKVGIQVVLLLCGGDKRKQAQDIETAIAYLSDYKVRQK